MEDKLSVLHFIKETLGNFDSKKSENDSACRKTIECRIAKRNLYRIKNLLLVLLVSEPCLLLLKYWLQGADRIKDYALLEAHLIIRGTILWQLINYVYKDENLSCKKARIVNYIFWFQIILLTGISFWKGSLAFYWRFILVALYALLALVPVFNLLEALLFILTANIFIFSRQIMSFSSLDGWAGLHLLIFSIIALGISYIRYKSLYISYFKECWLLEENRKLKELSVTDSLTGLLNRRGFEEIIQKMWHNREEESALVSAVIIDVDNFKDFNDNYGHYQGDFCLSRIAAVIKESYQKYTKAIARIGGDEFVVLLNLNRITQKELIEITKGVQENIKNLNQKYNPNFPVVTVSVGITAPQPLSDISWLDLYKEADDLLYTAKNQGNNDINVLTST